MTADENRENTPMETGYQIVSTDLQPFIVDWLTDLSRTDAPMRGLLDEADKYYDDGAAFMMGNIAPAATPPTASRETLLLFAVLAVFQGANFPNRPDTWEGPEAHLERAFDYAHSLGDSGVAAALLRDIAQRSKRETPEIYRELMARSMNNDPARLAQHDRDMNTILERSIRAARLLDPTMSLDQLLLDED